MDFDSILADVGDFGVYQKLIICSVLLPAALPCAFHAYSQLFISATPGHWCRIPEFEPWVHDYPELVKNLSIPILEYETNTLNYAKCLMYQRNYSDIIRYLEYNTPFQLDIDKIHNIGNPIGTNIIQCQYGWNYDQTVYPNTIVTEWNLVCHNNYYITLALVIFGIGGLIGNYIFGYLQDIWGRKPSFYVYLIIEIIACAISGFAWNYNSWLIMRFIVGLTVPAVLASPYVLAIEIVGPEKRVFCTIVSNIAYSIGLVLLSIIVYFIRDWRYLSLAVSLPLLLLFSCFYIMPESPRWLIAIGQYKRAAKILLQIAKYNGRQTNMTLNNYINLLENQLPYRNNTKNMNNNMEQKSYGIFDLFRTINLRKKTIIITFIWFANTSVYVGLSYYAPALGGNEIWNFFLAGAVELPTYLFLWPGLNIFGRRYILFISMLIGGIACLMTYLYQSNNTIMLILYCIGKMGISSAFVVLPLQASELYPTVVRGLGMSFSSVIAMIGPILIPIINHMGGKMLVLPLIIMGILLTLGGMASLFLPETKGKALPQTLEDGESVPLTNLFQCCWIKKTSKTPAAAAASTAIQSNRSIPIVTTTSPPLPPPQHWQTRRRSSSTISKDNQLVCSICQIEIKNF